MRFEARLRSVSAPISNPPGGCSNPARGPSPSQGREMRRLHRAGGARRGSHQRAENPQERKEDSDDEKEVVTLAQRCYAEDDQRRQVYDADEDPEERGHLVPPSCWGGAFRVNGPQRLQYEWACPPRPRLSAPQAEGASTRRPGSVEPARVYSPAVRHRRGGDPPPDCAVAAGDVRCSLAAVRDCVLKPRPPMGVTAQHFRLRAVVRRVSAAARRARWRLAIGAPCGASVPPRARGSARRSGRRSPCAASR